MGNVSARLSVPRAVYEEMLVHARAQSPREAVGLLGGHDERVHRCIPLPNALGGRHFLADPYAQFRALRDLADSGLVPLAVYHSHPGGGVDLSDDDRRFARRLPYLQLVIAFDRPHDPAVSVAAWKVTGDHVGETVLDIVDD